MATISTKFDSGVGILKRMRGVDVEEPAAVGAELLDDDLRRGRPNGDMLLRHGLSVRIRCRLKQRNRLVRPKRLHDALRHQQQGPNQRQRQQDVERAAGQIDPEIADRLRRSPRESANQRHQHRHARRRRNEVLHGQPEHLRQITQRAFRRRSFASSCSWRS